MQTPDVQYMEKAIQMAVACNPISPRIPKVGAVIVGPDGELASASRGSGKQDDDYHAEKNALAKVTDQRALASATLYTTLEPCTSDVRADPLNACSELIDRFAIKRVVIGILDPNQEVTGKGVLRLQSKGIAVELFPPQLADQIRAINEPFIKEHQALGIRITNLTDGQKRQLAPDMSFNLSGEYLKRPGSDVYVLAATASQLWPQPNALMDLGGNTWSAKIFFGSAGERVIYVVRANELGTALIQYYRKITTAKQKNRIDLEAYAAKHGLQSHTQRLLDLVGTAYPGINIATLPKGFHIQDRVTVTLEPEKPQVKKRPPPKR